jgi:hypothetical protein
LIRLELASRLNSYIGASHLLLLLFAWLIGSREAWALALWLVALVSLVSWVATMRRAAWINDTPTSRIDSAGQGMVELVGVGEFHKGDVSGGPRWAPPSLWYRYRIRERDARGHWRTINSGTSSDTFVLRDSSGYCVIDPDGAEVITSHRVKRQDDGLLYEIAYLPPGETIYVLGEFHTVRGSDFFYDVEQETRELLREWKGQPVTMARFDRNGDGVVDQQEWAEAEAEARLEAERRYRELLQQPGVNTLRQPPHGLPFLLANSDPDQLADRFRNWSRFHLALFVFSSIVAPLVSWPLLGRWPG